MTASPDESQVPPSPPTRRVTLKDVAVIAAVDTAIVSRVVNNDPTLKITVPTRTRVEAALKQTGYVPNAAARGLRTSRTRTVGVVLPDLTNPVYAQIVAGVQRQAEKAGYAIVLGGSFGNASGEEQFARLLAEGRVDGLLIATGKIPDLTLRALREIKAPLVLVNRAAEGLDSVTIDDTAAIRLATEHLLELGHRRIALINGAFGVDTSVRREEGFQRAIRNAGLTSIPVVNMRGWDAAAGCDAVDKLIAAHGDTTAIVVATVAATPGVLHGLQMRGLHVPSDVSVVALHDMPSARFESPPITIVQTPLATMGSSAFDLLLGRINGSQGPQSRMIDDPLTLVVRESSGAVRA
ncbi:LacI family DNA-binding transcriptional regulator [Marisediminicola antarctica]|uniref:HTH lacI-type domain-containing protein n=1 Tax=Marisediminicola antarctica TaxID=674079 RepID=A0A7L5AJ69_9MICO|nr:LacI family DNA-binding transcriptional regulator [Marisediminicola antarctica]QHO70377.1 hypothetical protein BHD05_12665 [Marisediminicola antarctica]